MVRDHGPLILRKFHTAHNMADGLDAPGVAVMQEFPNDTPDRASFNPWDGLILNITDGL
jgi:hypothetical protein